MAYCDLRNTCFFFNEHAADMPHATEYLRGEYCMGDRFTDCVLYGIAGTYGADKVPKYLYPNDDVQAIRLNPVAPPGGLDLFLQIMYPDGTLGRVKSSIVGALLGAGKIVAFQCPVGWVEARRTQSRKQYRGPERRKSHLPL